MSQKEKKNVGIVSVVYNNKAGGYEIKDKKQFLQICSTNSHWPGNIGLIWSLHWGQALAGWERLCLSIGRIWEEVEENNVWPEGALAIEWDLKKIISSLYIAILVTINFLVNLCNLIIEKD